MVAENPNTIETLYTGEGQITDQDVAHVMYNQTEEDRLDEGGPDKVGYFNTHGAHERAIQRAYRMIELEKAVRIDQRTGLPNDVEFVGELTSALGRIHSGELSGFSVAMFDWDKFGWMNDFFNGHDFGDLFLWHGAQRMRRHMRGADTLFHRSGDEFYAIFEGLTDKDVLSSRLEELRKDFTDHAFRDTIESALTSNRHVRIPGGSIEREGVWALQNIFSGLLIVQRIQPKQEFFLADAKGGKKEKRELISAVKNLDLQQFNDFLLLRGKTTIDFSPEEWAVYQQQLRQFSEELIRLFDGITLSCSVMVVTKENLIDVTFIRQNLDGAMYLIKEHGRNAIGIFAS